MLSEYSKEFKSNGATCVITVRIDQGIDVKHFGYLENQEEISVSSAPSQNADFWNRIFRAKLNHVLCSPPKEFCIWLLCKKTSKSRQTHDDILFLSPQVSVATGRRNYLLGSSASVYLPSLMSRRSLLLVASRETGPNPSLMV